MQKRAKTQIKVGFGFDIHRLVEGRKLIIAGMEIPHPKGLLGHSDGDVVLHAVCDAALGALAAGEIGVFYPPTDLNIAGISSVVIAQRVLEVLKEKAGGNRAYRLHACYRRTQDTPALRRVKKIPQQSFWDRIAQYQF